jgi:TrmH family RNA methyltransferase
MPELISSRSNSLVRQLRSLRQHKGRSETGLFLVEGIHHVGEAVQAGWEIETLVYSPDLLTSEFSLSQVDDLARRGVRCVTLTGGLFTDLAGKDNPAGILAITRQRIQTLENIASHHFSWGAACIAPQDLRTLDAVGADGLFLLDGGVELYHPSLVRASMGALFWKPVVQASFNEFINWACENGVQLVGSSAHAHSDYRTFKRGDQSAVLLLGNEQKGLSQEQIAACDLVVSLPMKGRGNSLNMAVAAGILLYAMMN